MSYDSVFSDRKLYFLFLVSSVLFTVSGFLFAAEQPFYGILSIVCGILLTFRIILIYNRSNDSVSFLFESLRNNDTTVQFPVAPGNKRMSRLYESMNQAMKYFQEIRVQNEFNEQYYRAIIHYSATGLVVMNNDNTIELINEIAARYGGISPQTVNYKSLEVKNPEFFKTLCEIKSGESRIFRNILNGEIQFLFFRSTSLKKSDKPVRLISIQDIRQELELKELESYRKLISVLTHEIMNLISPVTSVSHSLYLLYSGIKEERELSDTERHTINGLQVIEEQSKGIMSFVNNYRKISKIPEPVIERFPVMDWVEQLEIAYSGIVSEKEIKLHISVDKALNSISADKKLMNQVMINLFNNAIDALSEITGERLLTLRLSLNREEKVLIRISNNGPIIPSEIQEKVFVPFFTTKKNGSGIGLSISQEIIKMHKGSLSMISTPDNYTCFTIELFR